MAAIDMDRLERDVRNGIRGALVVESDALPPPEEDVSYYAPKPKISERSPLQIIAHAITRLTWREAVAMSEGIKKHTKTGSDDLTGGIQDWAKETFETSNS